MLVLLKRAKLVLFMLIMNISEIAVAILVVVG